MGAIRKPLGQENKVLPVHVRICAGARLINGAYFFVPYTALFAISIGLSVGQLFYIEALYAVILVLADIPLGHISDRIGAKRSVVIATFTQGAALIIIGIFRDPLVFVAMQPIIALAHALCLGSDSALQRELVTAVYTAKKYEKWEEYYQTGMLIVTALAFFFSALIAIKSLAFTFIATGIAMAIASILFSTLPVINTAYINTVKPRQESLFSRLANIWNRVLHSPSLGRDLGAMILAGTAFSVFGYIMPLYFVNNGVEENKVGILAALVALISAPLLSLFFRWNTPARLMLTISSVVCLLLYPSLLWLTIITAILLDAMGAGVLPRFRSRIIRDMKDIGESTALSIVSTARNLGFAIVAPFLGILTEMTSLDVLAAACAILFSIAVLASSGKFS